ncbi:MAG: hypothetical protein WCS52_03840 [bacterium]
MINIPAMSTSTLPPEIKVIRESMSVTRYVLPTRNLGNARKLGWAPIGLGLFITGFMLFWIRDAFASGLHDPGFGRWIDIGFGLAGLPGLAAGLGLIMIGIAIIKDNSHSEIVVGDGFIRAIDQLGPIPIRRKRPIAELRQLIVRKGGMTVTNADGSTQTYAPDLASLEAVSVTGKPLWMAPAYPHDLLRPLADVLAASLSLGGHSAMADHTEPVIELDVGEENTSMAVSKPAGTDITCQADPHGLAISVPPLGLWKGSQGLFAFSLVWNGFMTVFTVLMIKGHPPLPVYLFIAVFWAIGLLILVIAINMAKRKVLIAVVNNMLAYRVIGPFKTSEQKLPLDSIDAIRVGPSSVKVNNRPVMEIQIIPKSGRRIGLLSDRSVEEQAWLAYVLNQTLKVHATASGNSSHRVV